MNEVNYVQIKNLCQIMVRSSDYYKTDLYVPEGSGAFVISPGNIQNGHIAYDDAIWYAMEGYVERPRDQIQKGDIVIAKYAKGTSAFKSAVIQELPFPMMTNPSILMLKNIRCNPMYLRQVIASDRFQNDLHQSVIGKSMPAIKASLLEQMFIPLPTEETQERIARVLSKYEAVQAELMDCLEKEMALHKKEYEYYTNQMIWMQ